MNDKIKKLEDWLKQEKEDFLTNNKEFIDEYAQVEDDELKTADDYINEYDNWSFDDSDNASYDLGKVTVLEGVLRMLKEEA